MGVVDQIRGEMAGMTDEEIRLRIMGGGSSEHQAIAKQTLEDRQNSRNEARFRKQLVVTWFAAIAAGVAAVASIVGLFI